MDTNAPLPIPSDEVTDPQDLNAEQAILGAILLEPKIALIESMDKLRGDEFYSLAHRNIYGSMVELGRDGDGIDIVTLVSKLDEKGWLKKVGGMGYIAKLADSVPTAANIGYYMDIVIDKHIHRLLKSHADVFHDLSRTARVPEKLLESAQSALTSIAERKVTKKAMRKLGAIAMDCFEDIEHKYTHRDGTGVTGITSGFVDVDKLTNGFQKADFIVIGARPSVGKTAFAENIARNAAAAIEALAILSGSTRETVAFFSLEMSEKQLVNRSLSAEGNIDGTAIRTGHLQGDDWERLSMAIGRISDLNIWIDDTPAISPWEILAKCRRLQQDSGLGLILIDYLQLMSGRRRAGTNRQEEVSEISRTLKMIAKELDVPVIALAQLSRGVEQRQDKRPLLSDLRESGSIEQDADIVAFLYRDDYYDKETEKKNIIEVIIAKQRNGPIGTAELVFLKNFSKFMTVDRSHIDSTPPPFPSKPKQGSQIPDMRRGNYASR